MTKKTTDNNVSLLMKNTWDTLSNGVPSQDREGVKESIEKDLKNILVRHGKGWEPIFNGNTELNENIKIKKLSDNEKV